MAVSGVQQVDWNTAALVVEMDTGTCSALQVVFANNDLAVDTLRLMTCKL